MRDRWHQRIALLVLLAGACLPVMPLSRSANGEERAADAR